ncbi:MAG: adenylate/guanylate cyclase domain-containing protein [Candidatus Scalindua sp.]|nr:MAG: adenylate/guanylate cyclase domain-containing protein [Candidatus Scalindua sp.]
MMRQPSVRFSFRATLFTLMLTVLLTAVTLLAIAAYLYAKFAVENLGDQVLSQAAARVEQHIRHSLDVAEDEATTIQNLIVQGWLNPRDHKRATDYFIASLQARPSLSYLSFGMPNGKYYHTFRDRDGGLSSLWLIPLVDGNRRLIEFNVTPDGSRITVRDIARSTRTPPYDRPYYLAARDVGRAIWTESYVFLGSGESLDIPGVSRAVPVFASDAGSLLGVLTADFDLYALSRFLRGVELGVDGLCFLVEVASDGSPKVIAHPAAAHPDPAARLDLTEPASNDEGRVTVSAEQVADPRVTQFLSSLGRNLSGIPSSLSLVRVELHDQTYAGGFRHLGRESGPDWIICMLLPENEVFGDVRSMARLMVLLGLGGVLVAAVLSALLSRRVSTSLSDIAQETYEIGRFQLTSKQPVQSRIREISKLATSIEEMKTGLRSFQKYVPADLVRLLLESGEEAVLGGTRKELTVYFSDIVGFTSISEQLPADALIGLLSRYLEEMTIEILRSGGTVDKYIGDSIMAFWGAPRPHDSHAIASCRTALMNQARLSELRTEWKQAGLPELRARIGLHTGSVTVGNFGSKNRLDYTAIGDTVNIASRLESLNRVYGTDILISESTHATALDHMVTRPIDKVGVEGREQSILIYELVGEKCAVPEAVIAWTIRYAEALDHYLNRDWRSACDGFNAVLDMKPNDTPSGLMLKRCEKYLVTPPGDDWDGVFRATK